MFTSSVCTRESSKPANTNCMNSFFFFLFFVMATTHNWFCFYLALSIYLYLFIYLSCSYLSLSLPLVTIACVPCLDLSVRLPLGLLPEPPGSSLHFYADHKSTFDIFFLFSLLKSLFLYLYRFNQQVDTSNLLKNSF